MLTKVHRPASLVLITGLIGGILGATPAWSAEPDISPPVLTNLDFSPKVIEVAESDQQVTITGTISDETGVSGHPSVSIESDTTTQDRSANMSRVDGDNWAAVVTIPKGSAPGTWTVVFYTVTLVDPIGNRGQGARYHPTKLGVINGAPVALSPVTITGTAKTDQLLTLDPGEWVPEGVKVDYQWLRDGIPIDGQTSLTYSLHPEDVGMSVSARVVASKPGYVDSSLTSEGVTVREASLTRPTMGISGTGTFVGSVQTCYSGAWLPDGVTLSCQWLRDGELIPGETSSNYTVTADDFGKQVGLKMTATKPGYITVEETFDGFIISEGYLQPPASMTAIGTPGIGQTVTVDPGVWGPGEVTLSFQWYRDGQPVSGATNPNYTMATDDADKSIMVSVTGSKPGYQSSTKYQSFSFSKGSLTAPGSVTIVGTPETDQTLTVEPGAWGPGEVTFSYQWYRDGSSIEGATGRTYKVEAADVNHSIGVVVTGSRPGYESAASDSGTLLVRAPEMASATPKISGVLASGQTLTVSLGTWTPGVTFRYQWMRNGLPISGATNSTYKLMSTNVGEQISVWVTGEKDGYLGGMVSHESAWSAKVLKAATPKVSGTLSVGSTLKLSKGSWSSGVTFTYRWLRESKAISGATKTSYKLTSTDAGRVITVQVTGKRSGYAIVALDSPSSLRVVNAKTPTISGSKEVGKILTAKPGAWTAGMTFSYQWYANGKAISKATGGTLKLAKSQKGKKITVKATGRQPGYATMARTSSKTSKVK